ncbi:MAG: hypothetical protein II328_02280 [Clostridia bacterium]|nr:hypothetical protein [Clostridia bacterium]
MEFVLYGTDKRMEYLALRLKRAGHRVLTWEGITSAYATKIDSLLELTGAVRLVLPLSADGALKTRALEGLPPGSLVFGGAPTDGESAALAAKKAITWINLAEDDDYCRKNAVPTAEGALHKFLECTPICAGEAEVAVFGSGRVAAATVDLFSRVGISLLVCARNEKTRAALRRAGHRTCPLPVPEKKRERFACVSALFNTVPKPGIVDAEVIAALPRGTPILELASGKENIDLDAARARDCPVFFLPALPGKIAPKSAADALFSAITIQKDVRT